MFKFIFLKLKSIFSIALIICCQSLISQSIQDYTLDSESGKANKTSRQFNGYTNYWHDNYSNWHRYGNLFKIASPDIEKTILQSKINSADELGLSGLNMQEGFIKGLLSESYTTLNQPTLKEVETIIGSQNLLIYIAPESEVGTQLINKTPNIERRVNLNSHHDFAKDFREINAFFLQNGGSKLFVVISENEDLKSKFKLQLENAMNIVGKYDLKKGWFGAKTLLNSVTCSQGHPLEVIGAGMNEGNSWFVFDGYMDYLSQGQLVDWMKSVNMPIVTDVGFAPIYGCEDYSTLQVQSMFTKESWIDYANKKEGYVFRNVWDTLADPFHYDGYFAHEGNKGQLDQENVPFVLSTGYLEGGALSSMMLFIEKNKELTRSSMWEAILDRREVGILNQGKMIGPAMYRNALQMLLLDRIYLEDYFSDHINIQSKIDGYDLKVNITNTSSESLSGHLEITIPKEIKTNVASTSVITIPSGAMITETFHLQPSASAMDHTNAIAINFDWGTKNKSTVTMLDLPPAISVHRLLYSHAPQVTYPVTIHNFTKQSSFPVYVEVINKNNDVIFKSKQICSTAPSTFQDLEFILNIPAGDYNIKVSAMGTTYTSQIGVGQPKGNSYAYEIDLNSDGIMEYRMENDSVQVTLLAIGARVIEYIVKSRDDNVLFKLWPKKAIDHKRPFRERGYYPYGGFEDFLGQGSMETHQVYHTELIKDKGDFVQVKMWTDYYGNKLQKIFTLYGDSPLLEVRYALTFHNPEANVLGPQPILELGKKHWTEDVFTIPELGGTKEYRMDPDRYYGRLFFLKEGWNAAYDTEEDITYIGVFPVDQPLFLHMWQNHPSNRDAHHYYSEFQPWTPIFQKSTMYFTYYLWGMGGHWTDGVKNIRDRNLITTIKSK